MKRVNYFFPNSILGDMTNTSRLHLAHSPPW